MQTRLQVVGMRRDLDSVSNKAAALEWAMKFVGGLVRNCFSFFAYRSLTCSCLKNGLAALRTSLGLPVGEDRDLKEVLDAARNKLLPFATSDWVAQAPDLVKGLETIVRGLAPGATLGGTFPDTFVEAPRVPPPVPRVRLTLPGDSSSSSVPSPSALPSPSTAPPSSRTPSSGSAPSPLAGPSSGAGPTPRPLRRLPARSQPGSQSRRIASSPDDVEEVEAGPPARSSVKRPAPSSFSDSPMVKPPRPCDRCKHRKKGCSVPSGATSDVTCALCAQEHAKCTWSTPPVASVPLACKSFLLFFLCFFSELPLFSASSKKPKTSPRKSVKSQAPPAARPAGRYTVGPVPFELPDPPHRGTARASLEDLLVWHAEIRLAQRDYCGAAIAHQAIVAQEKAAADHLAAADSRLRFAHERFLHLMGLAAVDSLAPSDSGAVPDKGKRRAGPPEEEEGVEEVEDDGDEDELESLGGDVGERPEMDLS
jgi:hypothetical protein